MGKEEKEVEVGRRLWGGCNGKNGRRRRGGEDATGRKVEGG